MAARRSLILSPHKRKRIARKAARARWQRAKGKPRGSS
jgi:hypothetical protein